MKRLHAIHATMFFRTLRNHLPGATVCALLLVLGVPRSATATLFIVPSGNTPDIQTGIDAAANGDTVTVLPGTYTGANNRNLDFGGKDIMLISLAGPDLTIIDCQEAGRGFFFHSGESSLAIVEGFGIIRGDRGALGSAIRIGPTPSSPTIRNCKIRLNANETPGTGIIAVETGSPTFDSCTADTNTTTSGAVLLSVSGGIPVFDGCTLSNNSSTSAIVSLTGGNPGLLDCRVITNTPLTEAVFLDVDALLTGCIISFNSADGIRFATAPVSASVFGCTINSNGGSGVIVEATSPVFTSCTINENGDGGIVVTSVFTLKAPPEFPVGAPPDPAGRSSAAGTNPLFDTCVIAGNVSPSASGGGVRFDCINTPMTPFTPTYLNCTITGNSSGINGGGIAVCGQAVFANIAPSFAGCTISANISAALGGGIYMSVNASGAQGVATMDQTIVWGNCAGGGGDQVYAEEVNELRFDCSDVDDLGIAGAGTITFGLDVTFADPIFCAPPACNPNGTTTGAFELDVSSAAAPSSSPCGLLIGAHPVVCGVSTGIGDTSPPSQTTLLQNTPNPFNPVTTIRFDLARDTHVTLRIYDVAGRLVRTLIDREMTRARHDVMWDGTNDNGARVASGVYFYHLVAGLVTQTRKMTILK